MNFKKWWYCAGITNHDEYSLVRENQEDETENKPNFGTLTLRRRKEEKDRDQKMEQLKKKIKTDDERKSAVDHPTALQLMTRPITFLP